MNAYELADELQKHGLNGDNYGLFNKRIQNMLRQQADRIVELEQNLSAYIVELELHKAMIQDLEKQSYRESHEGFSTIIDKTTPQTKPLSDEEICKLFNEHTGLGVNQKEALQADLIVFARAIEERHGIK